MPDREKTIRVLETMLMTAQTSLSETERDAIRTAVKMLIEQGPVEPEIEGGGYNWWLVCGECHGQIADRDKYCRHCGRRIKHEKTEK